MITIYGRRNCLNSRLTKAYLQSNYIPHEWRDVDEDLEKLTLLKNNNTPLPFVETPEGDMWNGFDQTKLKTYVKKYKELK